MCYDADVAAQRCETCGLPEGSLAGETLTGGMSG